MDAANRNFVRVLCVCVCVVCVCVVCVTRSSVPSYLPMLKKTANGGLTLLDRAIKYLGAEQYDPAEVWRATMSDPYLDSRTVVTHPPIPSHLIPGRLSRLRRFGACAARSSVSFRSSR
jgi:hypothetical protein